MFAEQSIGKLLLAGVIPGLITAFIYSFQIVIRSYLNPALGPPGPEFSWKAKINSLSKSTPFLVVVTVVLSGIFFGVWTPGEAGAMGVLAVFGIGLIKSKMTGKTVLGSLRESAITSAAVFMLVIGCMIFGKFLALSGYTEVITKAVIDLRLPGFGLFLMFVIFYIVLGCFLEGISMMALTIPLVLPIALSMGWNPIWFGIIIVKLIEIA